MKIITENKNLYDFLNESFEIKKEENGYFVVLNSEEEKMVCIDMLALFFSFQKYMDELEKQLDKKMKDKDKMYEIIRNHESMFEDNLYYYLVTKEILIEHFNSFDYINMSAFLRFNLNNIKKEVKSIVQKEIETGGKYIEYKTGIHPREDGMFDFLKSKYDEMYLHPLFRDIHITINNNEIIFKNEKQEIINIDFIKNILETDFEFQIDKDTPEIVFNLFVLNVAIYVMGCKRIIIHNGFEFSVQRDLELGLRKIQETGPEFSIFFSGTKSVIN